MVRGWLRKQVSERSGRQENDAGVTVVSMIRPEQRHGFPSGWSESGACEVPLGVGKGDAPKARG